MSESKPSSFWWLKKANSTTIEGDSRTTVFLGGESVSTNSLVDLFEKQAKKGENNVDMDVDSIIEEINRVAAQSPLGPYDSKSNGRSVDELMKEAEKIYMESSKSFEQLSQRSKTSQNISEISSISNKDSTPTPKSVSPLPLDRQPENSIKNGEIIDSYSEDFSSDSTVSTPSAGQNILPQTSLMKNSLSDRIISRKDEISRGKVEVIRNSEDKQLSHSISEPKFNGNVGNSGEQLLEFEKKKREIVEKQSQLKDNLIKTLEEDNAKLKNDCHEMKVELEQTQRDLKELRLSSRIQNENDAKCIQDLNRQIKEMERVIARRHPDSVSALIVAAKSDATDSNLTARKLLEDRIKKLEQELLFKEQNSTHLFSDVQEKFNQMKLKYEHHIEDLELHVSDLKSQLKNNRNSDCYDIYTQTSNSDVQMVQEIPVKESRNVAVQTENNNSKSAPKVIAVKSNVKQSDGKSEAHLLATIRGLQTDLSAKEKLISKLQRELDELKKTNRRLQKEREGSLKSLTEKRDNNKKSTPSTISESSRETSDDFEFEKMKQQLYRIEIDYQNLKKKRIHDLNALQEAHEREIAQYIQNLQPLREQLELQQLTINTLQSQLASSKEELAIVTVERDHLNREVSINDRSVVFCGNRNVLNDSNVESLQKKLAILEKRYEERENRLRAIVNGLAQKSVTNRNCEQCAERQQQLISYKMELDQLLASLRALK